jgi:hypothetical protein
MDSLLTKIKLYVIILYSWIKYIKEAQCTPSQLNVQSVATICWSPTWPAATVAPVWRDASLWGGSFSLLLFVEVFLRCEGKINRVQDDLGLSYPTVRSRLDEVIRALGYEVGEPQETGDVQRQEILERLARKEISSEEAFRILQGT